ncbi:hypothetical protein SAMN02949497_1191 [Methylomagnum ishizawai]|uniref:Uncharacterized protein n=1 Tax=Methylomagnum ishizawai TaxID=1760988 RepID=A0A1Y6CUB9_9GAMM|nr:hypothetical protein [Methylomagnum ishizawai]SMF93896.1 hypothetical protein SAMN02949497_1191 [Methylomagnum ishizawai]
MTTTHNPQVSVKLIKVVNRSAIAPGIAVAGRYKNLLEIDLTPYLGDMGGVRTVKGVREPAGGFSMTFADQATDRSESLYGLIEPMDLVEIRMARNPSDYPGGRLPIVMRGFVSRVSRPEQVAHDGRVHRSVVVQGQDFGKLWQIFQIVYLPDTTLDEYVLTAFKFAEKYHIDITKPLPVAQFIGQVVAAILNPLVLQLQWSGNALAPEYSRIRPDVSTIGTVSDSTVNNWPGNQPIYNLLALACDVQNGFNEMFMDDREDGVALVLRPTPWKRPDGTYIQTGVPDIPTVKLDAADVVSLAASRSDECVANLFWVYNPPFALLTQDTIRLNRRLAPLTDYFNNDPKFYGLRMMEQVTYLGPPNWPASDTNSQERQAQLDPLMDAWLMQTAEVMQAASQDAVVFEQGHLRLKGNEKIKAGNFVGVARNSMVAEYYAARVEHEFAFGQPFMTTVHFERGTGFIQRAQWTAGPYWAELTPT